MEHELLDLLLLLLVCIRIVIEPFVLLPMRGGVLLAELLGVEDTCFVVGC